MSTTYTVTRPGSAAPVDLTVDDVGTGHPFLLLHGGAGPASVSQSSTRSNKEHSTDNGSPSATDLARRTPPCGAPDSSKARQHRVVAGHPAHRTSPGGQPIRVASRPLGGGRRSRRKAGSCNGRLCPAAVQPTSSIDHYSS